MTGHILVVEDNDDLRETLQILLEARGFRVAMAANGRVALEHLRADAHPSLILLDLMMPDMNGWELLEHVRKDASLASIPIVIMTAHKSTDVPPVAPEDVLPKPFDSNKLFATIGRYLARP